MTIRSPDPGRAPARFVGWGLALPVLSGLLLAASLPPHPLPVLAPVALVPLALHLLRLGPGAEASARAALAGAVTGGLAALLTLHWLPLAAAPLLGWSLGVVGGLTVWGMAGALTALAAWAVHRVGVRGPVGFPLAFGAAFVLLGWIPGVLPVAGLPWLGPEASLVATPRLLGVSDLVGDTGLAGILAFLGGCGAVLVHGRGRKGWGWGLAALGVGAGSAIYGLAGNGHPPAAANGAGALRIAALSVEADARLLADEARRGAELPAALTSLTREVRPGEVDLVLWPESPTGRAEDPPEVERARAEAARLGVPIFLGVMATRSNETPERVARRNQLLAVEPDGRTRVLHEKRRLVPAAEWRPGPAGVEPGPPRPPFPLPGGEARGAGPQVRAGALICFEALFPEEARRLRRAGARVLLLPSNDGWLAPPAGGWLDAARAQHEAVGVLRAVELRTPVVRSVVGGAVRAWDPGGRPLTLEVREVPDVGAVALAPVRPGPLVAPPASRGGAALVVLLSVGLLAVGFGTGRRGPISTERSAGSGG